MTSKSTAYSTICILLLLALSQSACAQMETSVVVPNSTPTLVSIRTFSEYTDEHNNTPSSCFNAVNDTVYIQVKVDEPNGYQDIVGDGYLRVRIVLWDGTSETNFARFGGSYQDAALEAATSVLNTTIYTYSFVMDPADESRTGNESPALYYRVKTQFSDGVETFQSDTSDEENADYNYPACGGGGAPPEPPIPPLPPQPVLFDVRIDIPENMQVVSPGDSFYATVSVTKISPNGIRDIVVTYEILDPENNTIDSYTETLSINTSAIYLVPVLYIPETAAPGDYVFKTTVSLFDIDTWSTAVFIVEGPTTTTTTTTTLATTTSSTTSTTRRPGGGGGGGGIGGGDVVPPKEVPGKLSIYKSPEEVPIFKGEVKPIIVIVENIGGMELDDVMVQLEGAIKIVSVVPEEIDDLYPGTRKVFLLEVSAPEGLEPGTYEAKIKAVSPNSRDEEAIRFIVSEMPADVGKGLRQKADWLSTLVDEVWRGTVEISLDQRDENVTEVFRLLDQSKEKIDEARKTIVTRRYTETETALNQAQTYIEESVANLAKIRERIQLINQTTNQTTTEIIRIPYEVLKLELVLPLLGLFLLILALLFYDIKRKGRIGRKLEEAYELSRVKDLIFKR